jgi:HK97 family phage prohead protease
MTATATQGGMTEQRAKYTQADRDKMAKDGTAMPDGSYPILDQEDLRKSIRAVGRGGADHDKIRAFVIKRAKALNLASLIPDNWMMSGALKETKSAWSDTETRETFQDLFTALDGAVSDANPDAYSWSTWVQDFTDTEVFYVVGGTLYAATYTVQADGPITLGDPMEVRPVTEYVPARAAGDECPTCDGTGKIRAGNVTCPDCDGTGEVKSEPAPPEARKLATRTLEWRREKARDRTALDRTRPEPRKQALPAPLELREESDGSMLLRSYASLFNTPYTVGSGSYRYEETVLPKAFKRTLGNDPDVVFRTEHGSMPLGRTSSGTLRLGEDERGLWYEVDLNPSDPDVAALVPKIQRRDLTESSFAFRCIEDLWSDDYSARSLKACDLDRGDVSIVTFGASSATGQFVSLRAEQSWQALRSLGDDEFLAAWLEWRDWSLIPLGERTGKSISPPNLEILGQVFDMRSSADDAEEARSLLEDLMNVPTPDASVDSAIESRFSEQETDAVVVPAEVRSIPIPIPDRVMENRLRLRAMQARNSRGGRSTL